MDICIAGKNSCAINALKFLINLKFDLNKIYVLPNIDDNLKDTWQPSLKKFALKKKLKVIKLKQLYLKKDLFFFQLNLTKLSKLINFYQEICTTYTLVCYLNLEAVTQTFTKLIKGKNIQV